MHRYDNQRIAEIILYILSRREFTSQIQLYKALYFAQKKHLLKWGVGIIPNEFKAWEYGPVPKNIYDSIKHLENGTYSLDEVLRSAIHKGEKDASDYLFANREPNMDYISVAEIQSLDEGLAEIAGLDFYSLSQKSHDSAWAKARANGNNEPIVSGDMAIAAGANDAMVEYIEEQELLESALR